MYNTTDIATLSLLYLYAKVIHLVTLTYQCKFFVEDHLLHQ